MKFEEMFFNSSLKFNVSAYSDGYIFEASSDEGREFIIDIDRDEMKTFLANQLRLIRDLKGMFNK